MKVEVLYFEGCVNHDALLCHLADLLEQAGINTPIRLVEVPDDEIAQRERFLGSPTVRIDGRDIEPGADNRSDFGLKCRLYRTPDGLGGIPADEWVLASLADSRSET